MSRDSQWGTVAHALRTSWPWPADETEVADLGAMVGTWTDLGPMVAAIEYYQRSSADKRPSVTQVFGEAERRRVAATQPGGQLPTCPTCRGEGMLVVDYADDKLARPNLRPCPTCRPGTASMHAAGHYRMDAPVHSIANRSPIAEAARDANAAAPRYGPVPTGPATRRPPTPDPERPNR